MPGLLSLVGEAIGAGRHHRSALEAERTIIDRLRDRQALIVVDEAHHLRDKLLDELRIIRDRAGCGLALVADETIRMALARCQQVDGRIGLKIDLATQPMADVEDIAAGVLGRRPSKTELETLNTVGKGPGGLHAMRRLLGRAWMVAQAAGRDAIEASDIAAAADEGTAADEDRGGARSRLAQSLELSSRAGRLRVAAPEGFGGTAWPFSVGPMRRTVRLCPPISRYIQELCRISGHYDPSSGVCTARL